MELDEFIQEWIKEKNQILENLDKCNKEMKKSTTKYKDIKKKI